MGDIPYELMPESTEMEKLMAYDECHFCLAEHTSEELLDICRHAAKSAKDTACDTIAQ